MKHRTRKKRINRQRKSIQKRWKKRQDVHNRCLELSILHELLYVPHFQNPAERERLLYLAAVNHLILKKVLSHVV